MTSVHLSFAWVRILVGFFIFAVATSCGNKKAEIVEALKVAKKHVANAETRIQSVNDILATEKEMFNARMKFKRKPVDSLMKYYRLGLDEKYRWQPIVDSLEWRLRNIERSVI